MFCYKDESGENKIQLIVVRDEPINYILETFYSTHIMNIASWKAAYCLFPETTLEYRLMCISAMTRHTELRQFDKWSKRGFTKIWNATDEKMHWLKEELCTERRVGDDKTYKVVFPDMETTEDSKDDGKADALALEQVQFRLDERYNVKVSRTWKRREERTPLRCQCKECTTEQNERGRVP